LDFRGLCEDHLHLVEFSYNNNYKASIDMVPYEALYELLCKSPSCWVETKGQLVLKPYMIREAIEKVAVTKKMLKEAQIWQKTYVDERRKDMEFKVGDLVFVKVSLIKWVIRVGKAGILALGFIGPFKIIERIGSLAYRVDLPEILSKVHNVFHASHLRKSSWSFADSGDVCSGWFGDRTESTVILHSVHILDQDEKSLENKLLNLIKVQWSEDPAIVFRRWWIILEKLTMI